MKSNKDKNELWKIEIGEKMKKIKAICCIIFLHWRYLLFSTKISLKKKNFRNL